jgi:RNA polymerase sigma-70 factor (ECF subfamily)
MDDVDVDIKLMERVKEGDDSAFGELVSRHYRSVYNLARRFLYDAHEAEDITQEVFLRVYRAAGSYAPKAKLSTWLYTITKNLCFNEFRKTHSVKIVSIDDEVLPEIRSMDDSPALKLEKEEIKAKVLEAVNSLPANLKIAVLLLKYHEFSYEEVAEILGCTVNAVKLRVHRAKGFLAKSIGHLAVDDS